MVGRACYANLIAHHRPFHVEKSKTRDCPTVGRTIKSIECGENRHRAYACPPDCPHSPFSLCNYQAFSDLEYQLDQITLKQAWSDSQIRPVLEKAVREGKDEDPDAWHAFLLNLFFNEKDRDGKSFAGRWKQAGYPGLRGDQTLLFDYKQQVRIALLEVQEILDGETLICVDLLGDRDKRLRFKDISWASKSCRFQRLVGPIYPTPHYWRPSGNAISLPSLPEHSPAEILSAIVRHHKGALDPHWLLANYHKTVRSCWETQRERLRLSIQHSNIGSAALDYELLEPLSRLVIPLKKAGFKVDSLEKKERESGWEQTFILVPQTKRKSKGKTPSIPLLGETYHGFVLLKEGKARLQAESAADKEVLRSHFETAVGPAAKFQGELVRDFTLPDSFNPSSDAGPFIVPELLEDITGYTASRSRLDIPDGESIDDFASQNAIDAYYRKLIDEPIPQLEQQTPRDAASDFLLRPKLIEWAKGLAWTIDKQNLETGSDTDINWLFTELGLDEINVPPPPPRDIPIDPLDEEERYPEDEYEDDLDFEDEKIEALLDLLDERMEAYPTAAQAMDDMESSGCKLIDEVYHATTGIIDDETYSYTVPLIISAWLVLVPPGESVIIPPGLADKCVHAFLEEATNLIDASDTTPLVDVCHHPELGVILLERIEDLNTKLPKKERLSSDQMASITATVVISINTLIAAIG